MKWFRVYSEARTDAKLESLTDAQHRVWFRLMCFAGDQDERGSIIGYDEELLAVEVARGDVDLLRSTLERLVKLRIIAAGDDVRFINWQTRQYDKPSDSPDRVSERVRRHRESKRNADVTPSNATYTETDADTDSEPEPTATTAREADVELSPAERQVVGYIHEVPGMAGVSDAEIVKHLRDVLSVHDPPPSQKSVMADAIRFRDSWSEKRADAPADERWRGWKNGVTNWFSRTKELSDEQPRTHATPRNANRPGRYSSPEAEQPIVSEYRPRQPREPVVRSL